MYKSDKKNQTELQEHINVQKNLHEKCENLFSLKLPSLSSLFESLKSFSIIIRYLDTL